ncbi:hypothetical protein [Roseicella aquatilis]|uniref:Uncharacterized protein n=1 Tax=Roseicella aquatilis TaxID=2527868 RepID=A0A4R4DUK2_9PROT|nr:hypothetical protein [Roseicella aquatilis]TCZ65937.1 hypothetical protein EXY23_02300 [Roseicella aquatilis]
MARHLIIAVAARRAEPLYFFGYRDRGATTECLWTPDRWQALWLDAEEARDEAALLGILCPGYRPEAQPVCVTQGDP